MIKKFLLFSICATSITAVAQQKKAVPATGKEIRITGKIKDLPNDSIIYLNEPFSGELDSAIVKNHSFQLKRDISKGGSIYVIHLGKEITNGVITYLEAGEINITGEGNDLKSATITGAPWVSEWNEVMAMISPERKENKQMLEIQGLYAKAKQVGDDEATQKYEKEFMDLYNANLNEIKDWIGKHPNSGVCGYLLTVMVPVQERDSLYATLGDHAKESRILQRWKNPNSADGISAGMRSAMFTAEAAKSNVKPGEAAPQFSLPDSTGKMVNLSDFKGKYVLIDFWASWCGPCKGQVPFLKAAKDKFKDKNFEVLGVSLDSEKTAWLKSIQKEGLQWPHLSALKGWEDPVAQLYGVRAIPSNVLIGPDGKVIALNLYSEELEQKLSEVLH